MTAESVKSGKNHASILNLVHPEIDLRPRTEFRALEELRGVGGDNGTSKYIYG